MNCWCSLNRSGPAPGSSSRITSPSASRHTGTNRADLANDLAMTGFNVGVNCGEAARQTVFHCDVDLMPRRHQDVEEPAGGIRHVITGKGSYPAHSSWSGCFQPPSRLAASSQAFLASK